MCRAGTGIVRRVNDLRRTTEAVFDEHIELARRARAELIDDVTLLAEDLIDSLERGGKLLAFGNGGSAADAQHLAAELSGRFLRTRPSLAALALTANTSTLTAIANDFSYAEVYARQVDGLCVAGDVVIGISTSGEADSVARGLRAGSIKGGLTWALTGSSGGTVGAAAERVLTVPSDATARVQEIHITIIHAVSELVDRHFAAPPGR